MLEIRSNQKEATTVALYFDSPTRSLALDQGISVRESFEVDNIYALGR